MSTICLEIKHFKCYCLFTKTVAITYCDILIFSAITEGTLKVHFVPRLANGITLVAIFHRIISSQGDAAYMYVFFHFYNSQHEYINDILLN